MADADLAQALPGGAPRLVRLCDYVAHYARAKPDAPAIVFSGQRQSYADLNAAVDRCARALAALGVQRGERVAMLTTPRPEFLHVLFATLKLGAIWTGVNPKYQTAEIAHILADCQPTLFVSLARGPDGRDYFPDLIDLKARHPAIKFVTFPLGDERVGPSLADLTAGALESAAVPDFTASPRDPACIVYTSGTTGRPKGAILGHGAFVYAYEAVSRSFAGKEHVRDDLVMLCNLPPNHIGCLAEMVGNTLIRGGALVLEERFSPAETIATLVREGVTAFGGVPAMLHLMIQTPEFDNSDLSRVKMIGWGGAPAPRTLVDRLAATGAHLFTNYGLTEGGAILSATPPCSSTALLSETVGWPVDLIQHRLLLEDGREPPDGEAGEIQLKGPGVFLGYWNNPAATAAALTEDGWLKTGDLAFARPDGCWVLKGRRSEMFKSGGYNVYPREIELALEDHPGVAIAAVVAAPDDLYFEVGHAFVSIQPGARVNEADLFDHLRRRLANYKIPKRFSIVPSMPMLPIGKIDKQKLRGMAASS